ncbi:unnamed protein product [Ectocarpus sp. 6 AP-2014]
MLWWGWLGFNGGSVPSFVAMPAVAARVMTVTVIGGASGGISSLLVNQRLCGYWDTGSALNGILAGLVSVTAGAATYEPEGAFVVGVIGGVLYVFASALLLKLHLDDVVNAVPVHLFGGMWGLLAAGFFASKFGYAAAYSEDRSGTCAGILYGGNGSSLGASIVFLMAVLAWVGFLTLLLFVVTKLTIGIRISKEQEMAGMDASKHGGQTYPELQPGLRGPDTPVLSVG